MIPEIVFERLLDGERVKVGPRTLVLGCDDQGNTLLCLVATRERSLGRLDHTTTYTAPDEVLLDSCLTVGQFIDLVEKEQ